VNVATPAGTGRGSSLGLFVFRIGRLAVTVALTFLGLLFVTFVIGRVIPIDPALAILGDRALPHVYERVRHELGLDLPLYHQFWIYLVKAVRGDLGSSVLTGRPVIDDIRQFFPATVELATFATVLGVALGVPMGVWAAAARGRWLDHLVFWLGLVGLLVFYARLDLVAGPGRLDVAYEYVVEPWSGLVLLDSLLAGELGVFRNALAHVVLPGAILGYLSLAYIARMTRSFMLAELGQEYVVAARVKGLSEARVIWRHALGNVMVPLVTVIALSYAYLLEGAVLTETVFAWPGLGLYITQSLFNADMTAVLGGTLVVGVAFVGLNLLSDVLYTFFDPRAR